MKKYNASDFESGDEVFHLTNPRLKMAIIGANIESNEVTCRWVDGTGKSNKETFLASELRKWSDKDLSITVLKPKRSSHWDY